MPAPPEATPAVDAKDPSILVSPAKIQFVPQVSEDCTLEVINMGFSPVMYRFLTTTPERFVLERTKGVLRGNASARLTITLHRKNLPAATEGTPVELKDKFCIQYALLGEKDVVERRCANVPQLLKARKAEDPSSIREKVVKCSILIGDTPGAPEKPRAEAAAARPDDPAARTSTGRDGTRPEASVVSQMSPDEVARTTLQMSRQKDTAERAVGVSRGVLRLRLVFAVAALLLGVVMWFLME